MPAYMHGSLAVERPKKARVVHIKESRRVVIHKKTIPTQEKLLYLFTILFFVVVAGVIIWRYSQIYEINSKVQQIDSEVKRLETENSKLKLDISKLQDPKRLIEEGKSLGLSLPADDNKAVAVVPDKVVKAKSSTLALVDKNSAAQKRN